MSGYRPSVRDVRVFGALLPLLLALLGGWLRWGGKAGGAISLWIAAALFATLFWGVPALRRPCYGAWMWVFHPIGWLVSHLLMAIVYYAILTPTGLVMRALGRDPMARAHRIGQASYWIPRPGQAAAERYFRQF